MTARKSCRGTVEAKVFSSSLRLKGVLKALVCINERKFTDINRINCPRSRLPQET